MKKEQAEETARRITAELFRTGAGETAERLRIELAGGRDGGGWCRAAVESVIARVLAAGQDGGRKAEGGRGEGPVDAGAGGLCGREKTEAFQPKKPQKP